jgi:hypothetical protein
LIVLSESQTGKGVSASQFTQCIFPQLPQDRIRLSIPMRGDLQAAHQQRGDQETCLV